jgi:hypothetical protein
MLKALEHQIHCESTMHVKDQAELPDHSLSKKPLSEKAFGLSSSRSLGLVAAGGLLCVASIFLPWSAVPGTYEFLPFSPIINLGLSSMAIAATQYLVILSIVLRVATIMVWLGVVLHEFTSRSNISLSVLIASSLLVFSAFGMFAYTALPLSWGAYLSLVGGLSVLGGVISEKLEIEIVLDTGSN